MCTRRAMDFAPTPSTLLLCGMLCDLPESFIAVLEYDCRSIVGITTIRLTSEIVNSVYECQWIARSLQSNFQAIPEIHHIADSLVLTLN